MVVSKLCRHLDPFMNRSFCSDSRPTHTASRLRTSILVLFYPIIEIEIHIYAAVVGYNNNNATETNTIIAKQNP